MLFIGEAPRAGDRSFCFRCTLIGIQPKSNLVMRKDSLRSRARDRPNANACAIQNVDAGRDFEHRERPTNVRRGHNAREAPGRKCGPRALENFFPRVIAD